MPSFPLRQFVLSISHSCVAPSSRLFFLPCLRFLLMHPCACLLTLIPSCPSSISFTNLVKRKDALFFQPNFDTLLILIIKNYKRYKNTWNKVGLCSFNGLAAALKQRDPLFSEISCFSRVLRKSFLLFLLHLWLVLNKLCFINQIELKSFQKLTCLFFSRCFL